MLLRHAVSRGSQLSQGRLLRRPGLRAVLGPLVTGSHRVRGRKYLRCRRVNTALCCTSPSTSTNRGRRLSGATIDYVESLVRDFYRVALLCGVDQQHLQWHVPSASCSKRAKLFSSFEKELFSLHVKFLIKKF